MLYNPFLLKNEEFSLSIQPGKYRSGSKDWQSDIGFSIRDENDNYIKLNDNQISTIGDLMNNFGFKVDKVERLLDSEFMKILLESEDQIEIISNKNESKQTRKPIQIIHQSGNMTDSISFLGQAIEKVISEGGGSIIEKVVYNGDEKKYISFCDGLSASIKFLLNQDKESIEGSDKSNISSKNFSWSPKDK